MAQDAFDILGVPARFDLDAGEIQRAYLERSVVAHPDRGGTGADAETETARVNEARRVLDDPERRAEALLRRFGGPGPSEDRSLPDGFLMEMLQIREEIETAVGSGNPDEIARWEEWAEERRRGHIRRVRELFGKFAEAGDRGLLAEIRRELNVWRYTERLLEQLDPNADGDKGGRGSGGL